MNHNNKPGFLPTVAVALALMLSAPAAADTLELSLGDAVALALDRSPARTQADVTRASGSLTLVRGIAGLLPSPAGSVSYSTYDDDRPWSAGVSLNQVIFSPSAYFGLAAAALSSGSQSLAARNARARLVYDVTVDYLDLLRSEKLREVAAAGLGRAQAYLDLVTEQRRLGLVTSVDLLRAQVRQSQARIQLLSSDNSFAVAEENFKATAGLGAATSVRAADSLERPSDFAVSDPDSLAGEIERRNPTARIARTSSTLAGLGVASTVASILPDVSYGWRSTYEGSKLPASVAEWKQGSTQSAGLQATLSLNVKSYVLNTADAVLQSRSARAARRAADLQVHANAVTAVKNYAEARARFDLADATLRLNEQLRELAAEQLRLGTISRVEFLDVETDLVGAQSSWVNGVCDTYVQAAQVAYLLGDDSAD